MRKRHKDTAVTIQQQRAKKSVLFGPFDFCHDYPPRKPELISLALGLLVISLLTKIIYAFRIWHNKQLQLSRRHNKGD